MPLVKIVKLPSFNEIGAETSIVPPSKRKSKRPEELEIAELMSIVPPYKDKVASVPEDLLMAALTVNVLVLVLPVVIETSVPSFKEASIELAKITVEVFGVKFEE